MVLAEFSTLQAGLETANPGVASKFFPQQSLHHSSPIQPFPARADKTIRQNPFYNQGIITIIKKCIDSAWRS